MSQMRSPFQTDNQTNFLFRSLQIYCPLTWSSWPTTSNKWWAKFDEIKLAMNKFHQLCQLIISVMDLPGKWAKSFHWAFIFGFHLGFFAWISLSQQLAQLFKSRFKSQVSNVESSFVIFQENLAKWVHSNLIHIIPYLGFVFREKILVDDATYGVKWSGLNSSFSLNKTTLLSFYSKVQATLSRISQVNYIRISSLST